MKKLYLTLLLVLVPMASHAAWYEDMATDEEVATQKAELTQAQKDRVIKIVAFGDSLMSGYKLSPYRDFGATLERELWKRNYKKIQVFRESVAGDTTTDGLKRLPKIVAYKPDIVLLELGVNDAYTNVPIRTTYDTLIQIIEALQRENIRVMLIGVNAPAASGADYQKKFTEIYNYLAAKYKLDYYPDFMKGLDVEYYMTDRIHPNQTGVDIMAAKVAPQVERMIHAERNEPLAETPKEPVAAQPKQ